MDMGRSTTNYGICRIDNATSRTYGWLVTIQRRGVIHRKHFSDGVHGGKQKALVAAKLWRDQVMKKYPPLSLREYSGIVKKSNRSGVAGVCRYCSAATRHLPPAQQRWSWVATWVMPDGKRKRVKFSVTKYGEADAYKKALKARRAALGEIKGNFEPGKARQRTTKGK